MSNIEFIKMHGLGNDFVIFDLRDQKMTLSARAVSSIANRRTGVGCDQVIAIETSDKLNIDAAIRIWNADGGEVDACGNAVRCVGSLLLKATGNDQVIIETAERSIKVSGQRNESICVDMGEPQFGWTEIPLAKDLDTLSLDISAGELINPVAISMGNPHAVFFVTDTEAIDLNLLGPDLECHPIFPKRANISIVEIQDFTNIRMRVWERGVGITSACGTGACAAVVAGVRRGLISRSVSVTLDGGKMQVEWRLSDNRVIMVGPVKSSFRGLLL